MPEPLRVVMDDRPLRRTLTGIGHYIAQLLAEMERMPDVVVEPFVFTHLSRTGWDPRRAVRDGGSDVGGGRKPWWLRKLIQTGYGVAFRHKTRGYDLYHEPNHVPVRTRRPTITTIHDLSVLIHPDWHPQDRVRWYADAFAHGLRQARRFITISEFTRREMVTRLGIDPERIDVTPLAARAVFAPCDDATVRAALEEFRLPRRFLLFVGTLEPRKNLPGLLDAYAALPEDLRSACPLAIVGAWGWKAGALRARIEALGVPADQVRLLGYVSDEQLAALYTACRALAWPTYYEGFGLPPLEAMACGAPAIVSDVASLPEVLGDAGRLLPVDDRDAWRDALRQAIEDDDWRTTQARQALARAATFTWQRTAEQTVAAYLRAVSK